MTHKLYQMLLVLQKRLEQLILATPSGEARNKMTEENIKTIALIQEYEDVTLNHELLHICNDCKHYMNNCMKGYEICSHCNKLELIENMFYTEIGEEMVCSLECLNKAAWDDLPF